jgi:hypothetical protein
VPIAHACASCGTSLTRVRAGRDPSLGLQVIVCPGCSTPVVRQRDGLGRQLRFVSLVISTSVFLAVYVGATFALCGISVGITFALLEASSSTSVIEVLAALLRISDDQYARERFMESDGGPYMAAAAMAGAITGFWLSLCLAHQRRRWVPWVLHACALLGLFAIIVCTGIVEAFLRIPRGGFGDLRSNLDRDLWRLLTQGWMILPLVAFGAAPVGWLLARGVRRSMHNAPLRRFAKLRARARKVRLHS